VAALGPGGKPAAVAAAVVVVFLPVADAALGGLTLALLGTGAALFTLAQLILGAVPGRAAARRFRRSSSGRPDRPRRGRRGIATGVK
jgi:hypothetical protein